MTNANKSTLAETLNKMLDDISDSFETYQNNPDYDSNFWEAVDTMRQYIKNL